MWIRLTLIGERDYCASMDRRLDNEIEDQIASVLVSDYNVVLVMDRATHSLFKFAQPLRQRSLWDFFTASLIKA